MESAGVAEVSAEEVIAGVWESEDNTTVTALEESPLERVEVMAAAEVAVEVGEVTGGRCEMVETVVVVG